MPFLQRMSGGRKRAAEREREARVRAFRAEIDAVGRNGSRAALERLRNRPAELGVTDVTRSSNWSWLTA